MGQKSDIEWTNATWTAIRARVKDNAAEIAEAKGYTSLIQIAAKMAGHVGPHCERVSDGCGNCYSETNNGRCLPSNGTGLPFDRRSRDLVDPIVDENILEQPLHWKAPKRVFVCSQTDLFGEWVTDEAIAKVFAVMALCPQHVFQILTKRPARMLAYLSDEDVADRVDAFAWDIIQERVDPNERRSDDIRATAQSLEDGPLPNVWIGVSAEDQLTWDARTALLEQVPAAVRFVSLEPQLAFVDVGPMIQRGGIHWLIQGGESGPGARPMHPAWVRSVRDQCQSTDTRYFFKQWGGWTPDNTEAKNKIRLTVQGRNGSDLANACDGGEVWMSRVGKKAAGAMLDGREWREFPAPVMTGAK